MRPPVSRVLHFVLAATVLLLAAADGGLCVDALEDGNRDALRPAAPKPVGDRGWNTATYDDADRLTHLQTPNGIDWSWAYDKDGLLVASSASDGRFWSLDYDQTTGRLRSAATGDGVTQFEYDAVGRMVTAHTPQGVSTSVEYHGPLLRSSVTRLHGDLLGRVDVEYDKLLNIGHIRVNGTSGYSLSYDDDHLLSKVGDLSIQRSESNGLITGTRLGSIQEEFERNEYGEIGLS